MDEPKDPKNLSTKVYTYISPKILLETVSAKSFLIFSIFTMVIYCVGFGLDIQNYVYADSTTRYLQPTQCPFDLGFSNQTTCIQINNIENVISFQMKATRNNFTAIDCPELYGTDPQYFVSFTTNVYASFQRNGVPYSQISNSKLETDNYWMEVFTNQEFTNTLASKSIYQNLPEDYLSMLIFPVTFQNQPSVPSLGAVKSYWVQIEYLHDPCSVFNVTSPLYSKNLSSISSLSPTSAQALSEVEYSFSLYRRPQQTIYDLITTVLMFITILIMIGFSYLCFWKSGSTTWEQKLMVIYFILVILFQNPPYIFLSFSESHDSIFLAYLAYLCNAFGQTQLFVLWLIFADRVHSITRTNLAFYGPKLLFGFFTLWLYVQSLSFQFPTLNPALFHQTSPVVSAVMYTKELQNEFTFYTLFYYFCLFFWGLIWLYDLYCCSKKLSTLPYMATRYLQLSHVLVTIQSTLVIVYYYVMYLVVIFQLILTDSPASSTANSGSTTSSSSSSYTSNTHTDDTSANEVVSTNIFNLSFGQVAEVLNATTRAQIQSFGKILILTTFTWFLAYFFSPAEFSLSSSSLSLRVTYVIQEEERKEITNDRLEILAKRERNLISNILLHKNLLIPINPSIFCVDLALTLRTIALLVYYDPPHMKTQSASFGNLDLESKGFDLIDCFYSSEIELFCFVARERLTRKLIVTFRGTNSKAQWGTNLNYGLIPLDLLALKTELKSNLSEDHEIQQLFTTQEKKSLNITPTPTYSSSPSSSSSSSSIASVYSSAYSTPHPASPSSSPSSSTPSSSTPSSTPRGFFQSFRHHPHPEPTQQQQQQQDEPNDDHDSFNPLSTPLDDDDNHYRSPSITPRSPPHSNLPDLENPLILSSSFMNTHDKNTIISEDDDDDKNKPMKQREQTFSQEQSFSRSQSLSSDSSYSIDTIEMRNSHRNNSNSFNKTPQRSNRHHQFHANEISGTQLESVVSEIFTGLAQNASGMMKSMQDTAAHITGYTIQVHQGFWEAYLKARLFLHKTILKELKKEPESTEVYFTGHSLGGALTTLAAFDVTLHTISQLNSLRKAEWNRKLKLRKKQLALQKRAQTTQRASHFDSMPSFSNKSFSFSPRTLSSSSSLLPPSSDYYNNNHHPLIDHHHNPPVSSPRQPQQQQQQQQQLLNSSESSFIESPNTTHQDGINIENKEGEEEDFSGPIPARYRPISVTMYNFGAPRVGNRYFASLYNRLIPDSYRVVVDGDLFTGLPPKSGLSFQTAYKHIGTQVVVDGVGTGSIIIDPTFIEKRFRVKNKASISAHFLLTYLRGLLGVKVSSEVLSENRTLLRSLSNASASRSGSGTGTGFPRPSSLSSSSFSPFSSSSSSKYLRSNSSNSTSYNNNNNKNNNNNENCINNFYSFISPLTQSFFHHSRTKKNQQEKEIDLLYLATNAGPIVLKRMMLESTILQEQAWMDQNTAAQIALQQAQQQQQQQKDEEENDEQDSINNNSNNENDDDEKKKMKFSNRGRNRNGSMISSLSSLGSASSTGYGKVNNNPFLNFSSLNSLAPTQFTSITSNYYSPSSSSSSSSNFTPSSPSPLNLEPTDSTMITNPLSSSSSSSSPSPSLSPHSPNSTSNTSSSSSSITSSSTPITLKSMLLWTLRSPYHLTHSILQYHHKFWEELPISLETKEEEAEAIHTLREALQQQQQQQQQQHLHQTSTIPQSLLTQQEEEGDVEEEEEKEKEKEKIEKEEEEEEEGDKRNGHFNNSNEHQLERSDNNQDSSSSSSSFLSSSSSSVLPIVIRSSFQIQSSSSPTSFSSTFSSPSSPPITTTSPFQTFLSPQNSRSNSFSGSSLPLSSSSSPFNPPSRTSSSQFIRPSLSSFSSSSFNRESENVIVDEEENDLASLLVLQSLSQQQQQQTSLSPRFSSSSSSSSTSSSPSPSTILSASSHPNPMITTTTANTACTSCMIPSLSQEYQQYLMDRQSVSNLSVMYDELLKQSSMM